MDRDNFAENEAMNNTNKGKAASIISYILGIIAGLSLIVALVVISTDLTIHNESFFSKEYELCQVDKDLGMDMKDVNYVSQEMMKYLFGEKPDLVVYTTLRGQYREFFNDREKTHMLDVKAMYDNAITVRNVCLIIFLAAVAAIIFLKRKKALEILARSYTAAVAAVVVFFGAIYAFILTGGFTQFWTMFHGVFFTNDLWLLDPATDMMILLLPEKFFSDLIVTSVITFVIIVGVLLVLSLIFMHTLKRKNKGFKKLTN